MPIVEQQALTEIIAHPEWDDLRLIYADWLEENGQPERGEFIRVQCRIADLNLELLSNEDCEAEGCEPCKGRRLLRAREQELLATKAGTNFRPECCYGFPCEIEWRRGFVGSVRCTLADWQQHGPALVRACPLEQVEVSDKQPTPHSTYRDGRIPEWNWPRVCENGHPAERDPDVIPRWLWRDYLAIWMPTREAALSALSAALLAWAREQPVEVQHD